MCVLPLWMLKYPIAFDYILKYILAHFYPLWIRSDTHML